MGRPACFDFAGWATKPNIRCSDGRTIMNDAFADQSGTKVPLVWNHNHESVSEVLGHAYLEKRNGGMYAYCTFNDSENGVAARHAVQNGDISSLSIFANKLKQFNGNVSHGCIREVSLVLAGANPGAKIDTIIAHSADTDEAAIIYYGEDGGISMAHSEDYGYDDIDEFDDVDDGYDDDVDDVDDDYDEDIDDYDDEEYEDDYEDDEFAHADSDGPTIGEVFDTLTDEQKEAVYALIGMAVEQSDEGEEDMAHNVFESDLDTSAYLAHAAAEFENDVIDNAKSFGSMRDSFLAHADDETVEATYGVKDIDWLFPEDKLLDVPPTFINKDTGWVSKIMSGVHHTPFSRIKSMFADITADEARAKGYIKGNLKKEEVFTLLKRSTDPQTIYKKQKIDRDDTLDITSFDVVAWIKGEMRIKLDEEIARAILIGDGRNTADDDKISEDHVRPIATDSDLFTIKATVTPANGESTPHAFITAAIKSRKDYKGSGNPSLFITEDMLADLLLMEDTTGRRIYESEASLATTLRVKEIVTVPAMENTNYYGIIVNLNDYNVGADKGGEVNLFDDFDIDYNQMKYLIETRISGALTKPYSAIVLKKAN